MPSAERRARLARLGRRLGILAFALPVAAATAIWTVQILRQVFWQTANGPLPECHRGVLELDRAVRRAREAAANEVSGERAALGRFRQALLPEWDQRAAVSQACKGDRSALRAVSELEALRYAEEHAVRYEAVALAKQRRRADAIRSEFEGPTGAATSVKTTD